MDSTGRQADRVRLQLVDPGLGRFQLGCQHACLALGGGHLLACRQELILKLVHLRAGAPGVDRQVLGSLLFVLQVLIAPVEPAR